MGIGPTKFIKRGNVMAEVNTYKTAGVDIEKQDTALNRIKPHCARTYDQFVVGGIGPFASVVDIMAYYKKKGLKHPYMLQSIDGPGTAVILAQMAREIGIFGGFESLGYNIASHCFSDVSCGGGRPMTLMDSISSVDLNIDIYEEIIKGMVEACLELGSPEHPENIVRTIGGEMAQMPGVIAKGQTDFMANVTAFVNKDKVIVPQDKIRPGQIVCGIPTNSLELNGISLYRKIVFDVLKMAPNDIIKATGRTVVEEVLQRQPNFAKAVLAQIDAGIRICSNSNITGGGMIDNVERNLPEGCRVIFDTKKWQVPPIFQWLMKEGNVNINEARKTWNMGVGMVQIFDDMETVARASDIVQDQLGLELMVIGEVLKGKKGVEFKY